MTTPTTTPAAAETLTFRVVDIRSGRVLVEADAISALYPESAQEWARAEECRDGQWVSVDGCQRHPDGSWR